MTDLIRSDTTTWKTILLTCGKCSRKLDGGFGEDDHQTLRRVLKRHLKDANRQRDVGIIETRCLGLCPKNAVTALNTGSPGKILIIPAGTPINDVVTKLLGVK